MKNSVILIILLTAFGIKAQEQPQDQNQSPYFQVISKSTTVESFPLLSTNAEVNITGPIADVKLTQTYKNDGKHPIEAIYVFPASTRSAVYAMQMKIGDRIIEADIQEKKIARQTYEKAKAEGKRTSLLEQHRPNVFQMNVGNILPGDVIEVILQYNEFLIPEDKTYEFMYPTVVGPRYSDPKNANSASAFTNMPYSPQGEDPSYDFGLSVELNAGMPIKECLSPSHKVDIQFPGVHNAAINLDPSEKKGGNRDFIFRYKLANDQISKGTFLYNHGDEQFFLTMIQPPNNVNPEEIPAREFVFVMDVSGSMRGFPLNVSKKLMKNLVSHLRPMDRFNVLLFSGGSKLLAELSLLANDANVKKAVSFIDDLDAGGGTQLLQAIERANTLPTSEEVLSRSIVIVTDGYVHVERETMEYIHDNLGNSNFFSFGIGSSVNRHLVDGIAHVGRGEAFVVTEEKYATPIAEKFRKYIQTPLLTNIKVNYNGFDAYDVIPSNMPDLLAERPLYLFGKYRGAAKGHIEICGQQGNKSYTEHIPMNEQSSKIENAPIRYLWAREKIRYVDDLSGMSQDQAQDKELTDLGLKYNLLTRNTSFVAVEEIVTNNNPEDLKKVKQVLPMPLGVSNQAIGFELAVEGIQESDERLTKQMVFAHLEGTAPTSFQKELKKIIEEKLIFEAGEKQFLNHNTVQITYNAETGAWTIGGKNTALSPIFKYQLEKLLSDLLEADSKSFNLNISMLWI